MSQFDLKIGPKIKAFRRKLGIQANKLAEQLNISPSYLNLIEGGKRKIDGDLLLKVCQELKIELSDLKSDDISEELFVEELYSSGIPDPDLLIRTGGEYRLSNFLLWQAAYSELLISEKFWPDFREKELLNGIYDYQNRQRRFGQTGEQISV